MEEEAEAVEEEAGEWVVEGSTSEDVAANDFIFRALTTDGTLDGSLDGSHNRSSILSSPPAAASLASAASSSSTTSTLLAFASQSMKVSESS